MGAKRELKVCRDIFYDRINLLYAESGAKSHDEFSKMAGITRQTISFYLNGNRKPDYPMTIKLCNAFHVSADWLLGLSDVRSINSDVSTVCKTTGLSEKAVVTLVELKTWQLIGGISSMLEKDKEIKAAMRRFKEFADIDVIDALPESSEKHGMVTLTPRDSAEYYLNGCKKHLEASLDEIFCDRWGKIDDEIRKSFDDFRCEMIRILDKDHSQHEEE